MIASLLVCLWGPLALATPLRASDDALMEAARAELERAATLRLPGQPAPYHVVFEILDGEVVTVGSAGGALTSFDHGPYRTARVEVRVGDAAFDNSNFDMSFGERDGVRVRGLPHEDVPDALRRELWLATDAAYKGAAEQLSAKRAAQKGRRSSALPSFLPIPSLRTPSIHRPSVDAAGMRKRIDALTAAMESNAWLEESDALGREWQGRRVVLSTEGTEAWLPTGFTVLRVEAVARAEDGARLRNVRSWVARDATRLPGSGDMVAEVEDMVSWLEALRAAPVERDYLGPVLFESAAAVEFFRQLALPEMSGTPPASQPPDPYAPGAETGPPTARVGRRLLPEGWTIIDDPGGDPGSAGHYTHDFEGAPATRVEVVRDGVVRDLLMSRIPRDGHASSTGHGRSLGADRRIALPGAVTVEPPRGRSDRALRRRALGLARQAGLPYVLVVRRLAPPAMSEDFEIAFSGEGPLAGLTRPVEVYRLHVDGRQEPVRGLEFVGVDRRALRDVAMAGSMGPAVGVMDGAPGSQRFSVGTVGGLPSSWAVPPVLVTEMEMRGTPGVEQRVLPPPPAAAAR